MKRINEEDFENFIYQSELLRFVGSLKFCLSLWKRPEKATLYGIRKGGMTVILESK